MAFTIPQQMSARRVVVIGLAIYAVALPAMILIHRNYKPWPMPSGRHVEILDPKSQSPGWEVQVRGFGSAQEWALMRFYENMTPLAADRYEVAPFGSPRFRYVKLRASDDTDPRENGRHYFAVLP